MSVWTIWGSTHYHWRQGVAIGSISLLLFACAAPPEASAPVSPSPPPSVERVVALTSLSADLVQRLDADKLVGIPGSRLLQDDPRFQDMSVVSEGRTPPNLETIVALEPDLVIGAVGFHDQVLQKLEQLNISTLRTEMGSLQNLEQLTLALATQLGAEPTAIQAQYQACSPADFGSQPSILVLTSQQPLLAPNKDSWAGDLLTRFQFQNVVADLQGSGPFSGYVTLSAEKVLEANPEILITVEAAPGMLDALRTEPFWQQLSAVQSGQVHQADYYGLINPGSLQAIQTACQFLQTLQD
ncbi:ABC transporter substrate-binding protein [Synechococcales cyanobacterium C]|uniref:ABC transporter substrate-binding protein n=1 Tax=Petrachloros mirabilis ULC683 TaxID=2781853 RepID=A0A8K2A1M3_9CYAN|nr:ABC transporter substrate-binding protein [Petrachloros mirabilis]NCJ07817.1 ABC transporter substrate-binding protein [Petrachloros mirabilis ULC683]